MSVVYKKASYFGRVGNEVKEINIPASITDINPQTFERNPGLLITVDNNNPIYSSFEGGLYDKEGKILIAGSQHAAINMKPGVEIIGEFAFSHKDIKKTIIPNSVVEIEDFAFSVHDFGSVVIPESVKKIGCGAFTYDGITGPGQWFDDDHNEEWYSMDD